jgi:predicted DNA-binding ribbon-helix-helix protein
MLRKRSLKLAGHPTSLALEPEFWATLSDMAHASGKSLASVISDIDATRSQAPLASACRVAALAWVKA